MSNRQSRLISLLLSVGTETANLKTENNGYQVFIDLRISIFPLLLIFGIKDIVIQMDLDARNPVFGFSDQVKPKPACSATD